MADVGIPLLFSRDRAMTRSAVAARRGRWGAAAVALLVLGGGCRSSGNVELLESKLREQESFIADLEGELGRLRTEVATARHDAELARKQLADQGRDSLVAEQAALLSKVSKIQLSPLLTRGVDTDADVGHERLSVLLMPVDQDGELVKLPGRVELQIVDFALPEERRQLGTWNWSNTEVRDHWHRGLLSAGYLFEVDWQTAPVNSQVTLHATFTAPDGRRFDATLPLTVTPPQPGVAKRPVSIPVASEVAPSDRPRESADNGPLATEPGVAGPTITPASAEE